MIEKVNFGDPLGGLTPQVMNCSEQCAEDCNAHPGCSILLARNDGQSAAQSDYGTYYLEN